MVFEVGEARHMLSHTPWSLHFKERVGCDWLTKMLTDLSTLQSRGRMHAPYPSVAMNAAQCTVLEYGLCR